MDERISALIEQLLDESTRAEGLAALDDEALAGVDSDLRAAFAQVRSGAEATDPDTLATLTRIRDARQVVQTETAARVEAAALAAQEAEEREAAAAALEAEMSETPETPEEPEAPADPEPEEVQVAAVEKPIRPSLAALAAARPVDDPGAPQPRITDVTPRWQLVDGKAADLEDLTAVGERILEARRSLVSAPAGFADKVTVATIKVKRPEEFEIRQADDEQVAMRKLDAVTAAAKNPSEWTEEQRALVASGGWCAPPDPRYEIPSLSTMARPVRDGLARIGTSRGSVSYVRAARLSTILANTTGAAVTTWEADTDETPGESTKTRQTFTCRTIQTEELGAIVGRSRFGNLHTRGFPEDVAHDIELVAARHARVSETRLLDALIGDMNVDVTQVAVAGTSRDLKAFSVQSASEIRYTERLGGDAPIRAIVSDVALDMIVADVTFQQASGEVDALLVDRAWARRFLGTAGVNWVYALDVSTGADAFVTNGDNQALADFPDDLEIPFFPDGTAVFVDGGELNLGIIRDSTLNGTNDYEMFMETFEGLLWLGPYGKTLTLTTCPAGRSQIATDITGALCSGS